MSAIDITHEPDRSRFEIVEEGTVIGRAYYRDEDGRRVFTHTEVSPDHQGQGLATRLIEEVLATTRDEGRRIVPQCPMVAAYVAKHQEFDDIVESA